MLRTNLSTRPFYNARAVQVVLGGLAILVAALTLFNAIQIVRLTASQRTLGASESNARREAARLRGEAERIRAQIDQAELEVVAAAAREANSLIDKRAFSWTDLMWQLEETLPEDVRVRSVQPSLERDVFVVTITVEARRAEDIDAFIEALEQTGDFKDVLPAVVAQATDSDLLEATIEGVYTAAASPAVEAAP
jgi:hypothetical protein